MGNCIFWIIFDVILNSAKCLITNDKKSAYVVYELDGIAYLLYDRELWQSNTLSLQFWCLSNALILQVCAFDASKSHTHALFCHMALAKVSTQLLIYNSPLNFNLAVDINSWFTEHINFGRKPNLTKCIYTTACPRQKGITDILIIMR